MKHLIVSARQRSTETHVLTLMEKVESVSVHTVPDFTLSLHYKQLQAIWSTSNLSSGREVSHPNHKCLVCMPILLWNQVLHHLTNLRIRNTLWCSNASKGECALAQIKGWFISVLDSPNGPPKMLVESILPLLLIKYLQQGELSFTYIITILKVVVHPRFSKLCKHTTFTNVASYSTSFIRPDLPGCSNEKYVRMCPPVLQGR